MHVFDYKNTLDKFVYCLNMSGCLFYMDNELLFFFSFGMYYDDMDVIALQIKNNSFLFLFLSLFSFIRGEMGGGGNTTVVCLIDIKNTSNDFD